MEKDPKAKALHCSSAYQLELNPNVTKADAVCVFLPSPFFKEFYRVVLEATALAPSSPPTAQLTSEPCASEQNRSPDGFCLQKYFHFPTLTFFPINTWYSLLELTNPWKDESCLHKLMRIFMFFFFFIACDKIRGIFPLH